MQNRISVGMGDMNTMKRKCKGICGMTVETSNFHNFTSKSELSELFRKAVLPKSKEIILVPWL